MALPVTLPSTVPPLQISSPLLMSVPCMSSVTPSGTVSVVPAGMVSVAPVGMIRSPESVVSL